MSKTITLTSKRDSTPYTWTGEEDTHTFANLPYGEYDVKIEESGYSTKTHTINHQGKNTYSYTLWTEKNNVGVDDTHYLITTLSTDQFEVDVNILYGIDPSLLTTTPSYIESNGKRYQVKSMDEMFGRKRLILDQTYQGSDSVDVYA